MNNQRRPTMRLVAFLLSAAVFLLASDPSGVAVAAAPLKGAAAATDADATPTSDLVTPPAPLDEDDEDWSGDDEYDDEEDEFDDEEYEEYDEEYEAKIEQALAHHASKSHELIQRALQEGGAAKSVEIGPDGNVLSASGDGGFEDELWQVEFAHAALRQQLDMLVKKQMQAYDIDIEDEDIYEELMNDPDLQKLLANIADKSYRAEVYEDIKYEWDMKMGMDPENWFNFKYWELHAYFSCARVFAGSRPVYDAEQWRELRDYWHVFRKDDKEELPIPEGESERTYQYSTEEFDPPLNPFQTKEKGRGLKAARNIAKGELVFKATNNTVVFTHGHTWRKFLFAINERNGEEKGQLDDATTCDVLVWSWVQKLVKDGPEVIVADIDNGSLLNEGRDQKGWELPNVRCGKEGDTICGMEYYATKDITEGDELLCDYRGFAMLDSWPDMGL